MEQQDVEETVGNLLENAARYARTVVTLRVFVAPTDVRGNDEGRKNWVIIEVEDDGPGLEPDQIREAMKRGKRLDESKPGTGLGLSIVSEIAKQGTTMEMSGTYTFIDRRHYTTAMKTAISFGGQTMTSDKQVDSKWIAAACKKK